MTEMNTTVHISKSQNEGIKNNSYAGCFISIMATLTILLDILK